MEIRILKYFLMVAREENITRAAHLLNLTQPTLSRQMIQLEEELGVTLFHRSKHSIILTEDGMLLRRRAEEIVSLAEKTQRDFQHKEEYLAGTIAIGSGELQSSQFLTELITSFQQENSMVSFVLYSSDADTIKERIERGLLDVGLLQEPVDITKYSFLHMPVQEQWGILTQEDSELAKKPFVSPEDLSCVPLILPERETVRSVLMNWFGAYGENLRVIASGNLLYNLASLARSSGGNVLTLKLDCEYDGLTFVPLFPKLSFGTVLVWKKTKTFSRAAAAFLSYSEKYILRII